MVSTYETDWWTMQNMDDLLVVNGLRIRPLFTSFYEWMIKAEQKFIIYGENFCHHTHPQYWFLFLVSLELG